MDTKQIKAICDAMSFLAVMIELDNDSLYTEINKYDMALRDAEVPAPIIEHFDTITVQYYNGRNTFCF